MEMHEPGIRILTDKDGRQMVLAPAPPMGPAGKVMLGNVAVSAIIFAIGVVTAATAPSPANDPACNTGTYHSCIFGDPQTWQGIFICAGAFGFFVAVGLIIGVAVLIGRVGKTASGR